MGKSDAKGALKALGAGITAPSVISDIGAALEGIDLSAALYLRGASEDETARNLIQFLHSRIFDTAFQRAATVVAAYDDPRKTGAKAATREGRVKPETRRAAGEIDTNIRFPAGVWKNPDDATAGGYSWDLGIPPAFLDAVEKRALADKGIHPDNMRQAFEDPRLWSSWKIRRKAGVLDWGVRWNPCYPEPVFKVLPDFHSRFLEQAFAFAAASYTPPRGCTLIFQGATPYTYKCLLDYWNTHDDDSDMDPNLRIRQDEVGFHPEHGICPIIIHTDEHGMRFQSNDCDYFRNAADEADRSVPALLYKAWLMSLRTGSKRGFFQSPTALSSYIAKKLPQWMSRPLPERTLLVNATDTDLIFVMLHTLLTVASSTLHAQIALAKEGNIDIGCNLVSHLAHASKAETEGTLILPFRAFQMIHKGKGVFEHISIHGIATELSRRFQTSDIDEVARISRDLITYFALFCGIDYQRKIPYLNTKSFDAFFSRKISDVNAGRWPSLFPDNRTYLSPWRVLIHIFRTYEGHKRASRAMMRKNEPWPDNYACDRLIELERNGEITENDLNAFVLPSALSTVEGVPERAKFSPSAARAIIEAHMDLEGRLTPASRKAGSNTTLNRHPHPLSLIQFIISSTVYSVALFTVAVFEERPFHAGGELLAMGGTCFGLRDPSESELRMSNIVSMSLWDVSRPFPLRSNWNVAEKGPLVVTKLPPDVESKLRNRNYFRAGMDAAPADWGLDFIFGWPLIDVQKIAPIVEDDLHIVDHPKKDRKSTALIDLEAAIDTIHAENLQRKKRPPKGPRRKRNRAKLEARYHGTAETVASTATAATLVCLETADVLTHNPISAENALRQALEGITDDMLCMADFEEERVRKKPKPLSADINPGEIVFETTQAIFTEETVQAMQAQTLERFM
jgi:hypothetical protein